MSDPKAPSPEAKKLCMTQTAVRFGRRFGGDLCQWDNCPRCIAIDAALKAARKAGFAHGQMVAEAQVDGTYDDVVAAHHIAEDHSELRQEEEEKHADALAETLREALLELADAPGAWCRYCQTVGEGEPQGECFGRPTCQERLNRKYDRIESARAVLAAYEADK